MGEVVAFVHAKGNSERVPRKSLKLLAGIPLFCHAVLAAQRCSSVSKVVVDSSDTEILAIARDYGAEIIRRPGSLSEPGATGHDLALWQAKNYPGSEVCVQVVPTSPFLSPESIARAVSLVLEDGLDSAVGVREETLYLLDSAFLPTYGQGNQESLPNSQDLPPIVYETTGLYANKTRVIIETGKRTNWSNVGLVFLSRVEAIDINTPEDFGFAELVAQGLFSGHTNLSSLARENSGFSNE